MYGRPAVCDEFEGLVTEVYDFNAGEDLVKILAHWIHHRDAKGAMNATMVRQTEKEKGNLDAEWLADLLRATSFFGNSYVFTCDIADSLVDLFVEFLEGCSPESIDQVYHMCKNSTGAHIFTSVFARVFLHSKKEFLQQEMACHVDRAVQDCMKGWVIDAFITNKDWNKLPPQLGDQSIDVCFHHRHGGEKPCYIQGGLFKSS